MNRPGEVTQHTNNADLGISQETKDLVDLVKAQSAGQIAQAGIESYTKEQAEKDKQEKEKNNREQTEIRAKKKKALYKVLSQKLDKEMAKAVVDVTGNDDGNKTIAILQKLSQIDASDGFNPETYKELLKQLRGKNYRGVMQLVQEAKGRQSQTVTDETEKLLNTINETDSTLLKVLEKQPLYVLEQSLSQTRIRLEQADAVLKKSPNNNEALLEKQSAEYEYKRLSEAVIKRDLRNYGLVTKILSKEGDATKNSVYAKIDSLQEKKNPDEQAELNELSSLLKEINAEIIGDDKNGDRETAVNNLRAKLEKARSLLEKHFDTDDLANTDETVETNLSKRLRVDKYQKAREIVNLLPPTEVQTLRKKIEKQGVKKDLFNQYILALDKSGNVSSLIEQAKSANIADQGAYEALIKLWQAAKASEDTSQEMSEDDQYELVVLLSSFSTKLDSIETQKRLAQKNELAKVFSSIPETHKRKLLKLAEIDIDGKDDQQLYNALTDEGAIKKLNAVLEEFIKAETETADNDHTRNFADYVQTAVELFGLDIEHQLHLNSEDVKVHSAKMELVRRISLSGRLSLDDIRETFNLFEIPGLDIRHEDGAKQFIRDLVSRGLVTNATKEAFEKLLTSEDNQDISNLNLDKAAKIKAILVKQAVLFAREEGPEGLNAWRDNFQTYLETREHSDIYLSESEKAILAASTGQYQNLVYEICDQVTEALIYPYLDINIGQGEDKKLLPDKLSADLLQQMLAYRKEQLALDKEAEAMKNPEYRGTINRHMFKNVVFNNILNQWQRQGMSDSKYLEAKQGLAAAMEDLQAEDDKELLQGLLDILQAQSVVTNGSTLQQLKSDLEKFRGMLDGSESTSAEAGEEDLEENPEFSLEKLLQLEVGPGGMFINIANEELIQRLLGLDSRAMAGVKGVTFKPENLLTFKGPDGKQKLPGYLAIVNSESKYHERLHLLEMSLNQHLREKVGEVETDYYRYGLDELVANLISADYEEVISSMRGLSWMNITLTKEQLAEIENADDKTTAFQKIINSDENLKKAYTILDLSKQITAEAAQVYGEDEEAKALINQTLRGILSENGNNLDQIIYNLYRNYPEFNLDQKHIGERQKVLHGLKQKNQPISSVLASQRLNERLNIFTGETIDSDSWDSFIALQKEHAASKSVFTFMNGDDARYMQQYEGLVAQSPSANFENARVPDPLGDKDIAGNYYKSYGRELKSGMTMLDTLIRRKEIPSYFEEKYPLRWVHLPGANKVAPISWLEMAINGGIDNGIARGIWGLNTRDYAGAWAGTKWGNWLGISDFRSSAPSARWGYRHPMARAYQEYFGEKYKGLNEKDKYTGHIYPDYMRNSPLNDLHFTNLSVEQEALSRYIGGGQTYSLLEKQRFTTLNAAPNDRPSSNPEINDQKAGRINDFTLERIYAEAMNFSSSVEDQVGYNEYQTPFKLGFGSWKNQSVVVDKHGNMLIQLNEDIVKKIPGLDAYADKTNWTVPLSEDIIRRFMPGAEQALKTNGTFFSEWRPNIMFYNGAEYYVHYDPRDGMPKLFDTRHQWIDWRNPPEPLKDVKSGRLISPREAKYKYALNLDSARHRMDMNIAVNGLYRQIMEARELQRQNNEGLSPDKRQALYSFKDLIRSTHSYKDPDSPHDGIYVTKDEAKRKHIRIPIKTYNEDGQVQYSSFNDLDIDYGVALELTNRLEKWDIRDNIKRQAFIKGSPERVRETELVISVKHRENLRMYLEKLLDDDMEFYGKVIGYGETPPQGVADDDYIRRIPYDQVGDNLDNPYFRTPEGAAVKLRYLKENTPIDQHRTNAEILTTQDLVDKFAYFDEYEDLLYDGMYSMFVNDKSDPNQRKRIREVMRNYIYAVMGTTDNPNSLVSRVMKARSMSEEEARAFLMQELKKDDKGDVDVYRQKSKKKKIDDLPNLFGHVINRFFKSPILADADEAFIKLPGIDVSVTIGEDQNGNNITENLGFNVQELLEGGDENPALIALNKELDGLLNTNYDQRPIERLLSDKTSQEAYELSNELMGLMQDRAKYRQEMRNMMYTTMELAEFFSQEFNRYRRAKYFWESLAKLSRRINTPIFLGAMAALFLTTSPIILPTILASMGYAKLGIPFMDKWTAITVNRRNYSRELARKMRSEANRVIEMYEKGMTLTHSMRQDMNDMVLEYNIMGESIQGQNLPNGWAPGGNIGVDSVVNILMNGDSGIIPRLISS